MERSGFWEEAGVFHQTQIQREAARDRTALYKAAHWRAQAEEARETAKRMGGEMRATAMQRIAEDLDFLAEYEERSRRRCL